MKPTNRVFQPTEADLAKTAISHLEACTDDLVARGQVTKQSIIILARGFAAAILKSFGRALENPPPVEVGELPEDVAGIFLSARKSLGEVVAKLAAGIAPETPSDAPLVSPLFGEMFRSDPSFRDLAIRHAEAVKTARMAREKAEAYRAETAAMQVEFEAMPLADQLRCEDLVRKVQRGERLSEEERAFADTVRCVREWLATRELP